MNDLLHWFKDARLVLEAVGILLLGFVLTRLVGRQLKRAPLHAQQRLVLLRLSNAIILGFAVATALGALGLKLGVLLGAAGVATVALGFAAQTSVSNLISGVFLMVEQPFVVGDVIDVGGITGEVLSIDLIAVRLRTFDNVLARIPNETMLKANVKNMTHFQIRRVDMKLGVAYKEDLGRVKATLFELAERNILALRDPAPQLQYLGFGDSSIDIQFSVWAARPHFLDLRNSLYEEIKKTFDEKGIEIPFPHRTLYAGSVTLPIPVKMTEGA
jgi:small-conductance mechanosensitive channel